MLIDVNAWIGCWPFQQRGDWSLEALARTLARSGVSAACVASLDALLLPDPMPIERELGRTLPSADPASSLHFLHTPLICHADPSWKTNLRTLRDEFGIRMIRLAPTYRPGGFQVDAVAEVVRAAAEMNITTSLSLRLEDERTQSPLLNVSPIKPEQVLQLARRIGDTPLLLLNAYWSDLRAIKAGAATDPPSNHLFFDLAMVDGPVPLDEIAETTRPARLLFGTGAPMLHAPAARAKMDLADLKMNTRAMIEQGNARFLLGMNDR